MTRHCTSGTVAQAYNPQALYRLSSPEHHYCKGTLVPISKIRMKLKWLSFARITQPETKATGSYLQKLHLSINYILFLIFQHLFSFYLKGKGQREIPYTGSLSQHLEQPGLHYPKAWHTCSPLWRLVEFPVLDSSARAADCNTDSPLPDEGHLGDKNHGWVQLLAVFHLTHKHHNRQRL